MSGKGWSAGCLLLLLSLWGPGLIGTGKALDVVPDPRPWATLTDTAGQSVRLRLPVRRLVTTNGLVAEIICALGGAEAIVGLSDYTLQHSTRLLPELQGKAGVGAATNPSLEKVVDLQPELVIAFHRWMAPPDLEAKLTPLGIAVARLNAYQFSDIPAEIAFLGRILGKEREARLYLEHFQQLVTLATSRTRVVKPVRVYQEGFADYSTFSARAPDHETLALIGLTNVAAALPIPFPKVSAEWVILANPQVIIKSVVAGRGGLGYGQQDRLAAQRLYEDLVNRPAWHQIDAVRHRRVVLLASELNAGPRMAIGLLYKAKWCHPERFTDLDPAETHRQWLWRWHRRELQGIFVYP